jgi:hypothetical protein
MLGIGLVVVVAVLGIGAAVIVGVVRDRADHERIR